MSQPLNITGVTGVLGDCLGTLTTYYKILKALMSNATKGPKEIAIETNRQPGSVRNALVHMTAESLIKRVDYGKYTITDLGREEYARLSRSPSIPSSRRQTQ